MLLCRKEQKVFDVVPTEMEVVASEVEVAKTTTEEHILKLKKPNKQAYMELV